MIHQFSACRFLVLMLASSSMAVFGGTAVAQEKCGDRPIIDCLDQAVGIQEDAVEIQKAAEDKATAEQTSAARGRLNATELASFDSGAKRSFLESFLAELDGFSTSSDDENNLVVVYNAPNQVLSGKGVLYGGEVSEDLLAAYPEAIRAARGKELAKGLDDFSDVAASLTVNFHKEGEYGRRTSDYAPILRQLVATALPSVTPTGEAVRELQQRRFPILNRTVPNTVSSAAPGSKKVAEATWKEIVASGDADLESQVRLLFAESDRLILESRADALKASIEGARLHDFYKLLANQPQRYLEAGGRFRDEVVGPNSWSAKFVWEMPTGGNLNKLRAFCRRTRASDIRLDCYREYLSLENASLRSQDSFKLEVVGEGTFDWDFEDLASTSENGEPIRLAKDAEVKATVNLAYTRVLRYLEDSDVAATRIDAQVAGEYTDDEEIFRRRVKAEITLVNRINDEFDAALTLVYASEPEWRGEVDKEFSAQAGLRFKFGQTDEGAP